MQLTEQQEQQKFEDDVRAVARLLWPSDQYAGARLIDGKEHDGLFETEECIHLIESTVSRKRDKAETDCNKLRAVSTKLKKHRQEKAIQSWFVTKNEPTADQRETAFKISPDINCLSFSQFQARLIDIRAYISARDNYQFGSVRDPDTGAYDKDIEYLPISLYENSQGKIATIANLVERLAAGERLVLLGDYGAGKSMTMREIYRILRARYFKDSGRFPVYLNLRDHSGQDNAAEILERHARNIGFPNPSHLVRAWRAGLLFLLIDGFDEVSGLGFQGLWRRLQEARYRSMEGVRALVQQTPSSASLIVSGRAHYFDGEQERKKALGVAQHTTEVNLSEFSEDQVSQYLEKAGYIGAIPTWIPSRPLLLGYLVSRKLIGTIIQGALRESDPSTGWDMLLEKIADREAQIEAGIDGTTVRRILERLATTARKSVDGLGPLDLDALTTAFTEICGYAPDERGLLLLQRLPGLGVESASGTARKFIDEHFADACRSGDVLAFLTTPYTFKHSIFDEIEFSLGQTGLGVLVQKISKMQNSPGVMTAALTWLGTKDGSNAIATDLVLAAFELGIPIENNVFIKNILIRDLELSESNVSYITIVFNACYIPRLGIPASVNSKICPHFSNCMIGSIEGRYSDEDLPQGMLGSDCVVDGFAENLSTTTGILGSSIPRPTRVLLTMLKKLYIQSGGGRKESALTRGLEHQDARYVTEILRAMQSLHFVTVSPRSGSKVWLPDRSKTDRVKRILAAPTMCDDPLIKQVSEMA